ncbi:sec63-domain-containing protein [Moesziomyces antarcticus]|uniref:RNA helicase n=2 Tax=Pseudozyma antarctica TaxID=84753 RepID=A0A081CH97_PSEA2|nr:sec63-domain-containing protein [Moesziomyces antarcticus]GAK66043.1 sec63-domain-containing protein [Moesziomyces antarcticus]SPO46818.1 probable ATP dependent RNA helicase [Moesziomyces antarcticus]
MPPKKPDLSGYQYSALSSLVISADRPHRRPDEPSGEAESLAGRINVRDMGTAVKVEGVKDLDKKRKKANADDGQRQSKRQAAAVSAGPSSSVAGGASFSNQSNYTDILQATAELEGLRYHPRTQETRDIYELILSIVHTALGDQAQDVVRSAADTTLEILKDPNLKDLDKRSEIEDIIGSLSTESFGQLINLSKKITDYDEPEQSNPANDADAKMGEIDQQTGVAVLFDEEEEDSDQDGVGYVVRDGSDDSDASDDDDADTRRKRARSGSEHPDSDAQASDQDGDELVIGAGSSRAADASQRDPNQLHPRDVDAFWIQRQIAQHYPDAHEASEKADAAFDILSAESDVRDCENSLMELFDYDKFELVQILTKHRDAIVWCTRLARADDDEKVNVQVAMREKGVAWILKALQGDDKPSTSTNGKSSTQPNAVDLEDAQRRSKRLTSRATIAPGSTAQPRKGVDLEAMAFAQGGHLNTNAKVRLPEGSFKRTKKGYEEIHIPAPAKRTVGDADLVPISSIPAWAQAAFPGATSLNPVQSRCYPVAFGSDEPMLLCAPTGAGKTNVAMLTVLNEIGKWRDDATGDIDLNAFKIVYVAPMKALVSEQAANFRDRLQSYGITVNELTGDSQLTKAQIAETQIIVTTPEKWDVISRKSTDTSYTNLVRLLIVDEIHLLHDDRGPVLEAIISRTIRRMEQMNDPVRLVGLSATLPNYQDVATFLRVNPKSGLFYFEANYRPCPLKQEYVGITEKKAIKRLLVMNEVTYEKTLDQAGKNQVLIFVHSRKETAKTAKFIRDRAMEQDTLNRFLPPSPASQEVLRSELDNVTDGDLKDLMPYGFGIHHAGMSRLDRELVEALFADGHLQVLVSTATLAWGVNLPAHTVIIKGTQIYNPEKGRWCEITPQDMLQMLGRAGRPQYDTFGEGIIITNHSELQYYLSLLNQQLPIESQLVSKLADNLNAEIVLGTIRNRDEAVAWLGYTYLYVRMLRSPALYSVTADYAEDDPFLEQKRADIVHTAAALLEKCGLLRYERRSGNFVSNELGRIASHYYITHDSMATYHQQIKPQLGLIELFRVFALSNEFRHQVVRQDEKLEVAKLLERVPVPVKESADDPIAKVNVLLQSWISQLRLDGYVLAADMVYITQSAGRILRAIFEICLKRGYARLSRMALDLCKMVESRQWGSMTPLRQFRGVPADLIRRLERKEYPWNRLRDLEPNEIGELIGIPKAGRLVHRLVHQFPRLELQAFFQPLTRSLLHVQLTITPDFQWDEKVHGGAQSFWIMVEDVDAEILHYHDQFLLLRKYAEEEHTVSFTIPMTEPLPPNYYISVVSDRWLHSEVRLPISFKNLILPEKFPPHTPLLELQPQPLSALNDRPAQELYRDSFAHFNKVQTQTFHALYGSDDSVFVGAPTGSGKTVCAELALLRLWKDADAGRAVCVVPYESMVAPRVAEWKTKFGEYQDGKEVVALTGETSADLRLLEMADVVVTIPEHWDVLSRRWRQRKNVQSVALYIFDEIHMIGDWRVGPTYEIVASRARFVAAQTERPTRMVALSVPLANARDVGDWLGAPSGSVFNFAPSARQTPMEVHIQTFSMPHFPSMMIAMAKPAYLAIIEHAPDQPVIAFVPSRKQAKLTANDLLAYVLADSERDDGASDDGESRFLNIEMEDLEPHLQRVQDRDLRELLASGIAYYHEGLTKNDRRIVERLFAADAIRVVVASKETAWSIPLTAHLVLIMSLQTYEGREHRYVDYALPDVLQMVGRCTVPNDEGTSRCVLLCQATRKEYFKKFLAEGLPVESRLTSYAQDFFNAEIVARTIDDKQAAVDILTWTLMYRRLQQNPQAYNCQGKSMQHIGDYLSELVETTLADLENSKCIAIEDEMDVSPLNLGMIASYYNVSYVTIDVFNMSLKDKTKLRGMLEIVSSAAEFEDLPIRQHEDVLLQRLYDRLPLKLDRLNLLSPYHKVYILLQAHFARLTLPVDLEADQRIVLGKVLNLLSACVDVMSSNAYLNAIVAMELSQMVVQAVWDKDSVLRQVPHFSAEVIERCRARGVEDVFGLSDLLADLSEVERDELLQMDKKQTARVAAFVNAFPYIELSYSIETPREEMNASDPITVRVTLDKDDEDDEEGLVVQSAFYPARKLVQWWVVIGDPATKNLLAIKKVTVRKTVQLDLEVTLPQGRHDRLKMWLVCDSYLGADREVNIEPLDVMEGHEESEESEDDEESDDDE